MAKPATEVVDFSPLPLRAALTYHLIYHYSFMLHVNHLIFLHTYLFGMLLLLASSTEWLVLAGTTAVYAMYVIVLTQRLALPYVAFVGGLAAAAWELQRWLSIAVELAPWMVALIAVGVVLSSFICQLVGHAVHERFQAPPAILHGFVAAPPLEYVSLLGRLGFCPSLMRDVMPTVEDVRERAGALLGEQGHERPHTTPVDPPPPPWSGSVSATPNVWEHHARALYINLPLSASTASRIALERSTSLQPATYHSQCWLSVVVDDLDSLWAYVGGLCVPTG